MPMQTPPSPGWKAPWALPAAPSTETAQTASRMPNSPLTPRPAPAWSCLAPSTPTRKATAAPWYRQPSQAGGVTAALYLIVADCKPLWAKAQAVNADILQPLKTMDYGGSAFSLKDPEGFVWSIGEYNPWSVAAPPAAQ